MCLSGVRRGTASVEPASYAAAGLTWWLESVSPSYGSHGEMLDRIRAGPPDS
jgi:hypothetical protein